MQKLLSKLRIGGQRPAEPQQGQQAAAAPTSPPSTASAKSPPAAADPPHALPVTAEHKPYHPLHTYPKFAVEFPRAHAASRKRHNMKQLPNNICFEISNFLTAKECELLITEAERIGFSGIEWEYTPDYRKCDRLVARSRALAKIIWERLLPFLTRDDVVDVRPFGFGAEGVWQPLGINDVVRFTRYSPGGHFQMHRDGAFLKSDEERSIFTVMAYLNDAYTGGATRFLDEGKVGAESKGQVGSVLVFNHDIQHEGLPVIDGKKYILRTDIMFRRIDCEVPLAAYKENPNYKEACALYDKSIELQKVGDPGGSTQAYLEALEAQAKLRSVPLPVGPEVRALPAELYAMIFCKLPMRDLLRAAQVSRGWRRLTRDPRIWRAMYMQRWPDFYELETIIAENDIKDWYVAYKKHHVACRDFPIIVIDVGHEAMDCRADRKLQVSSTISQYSGHYWTAGEGLENMMIGTNPMGGIPTNRGGTTPIPIFTEAVVTENENDRRRWRDPISLPIHKRLRAAIMWVTQIGLKCGKRLNPILIARCPSWPQTLVDSLRHEICFARRAASDYVPFYTAIYSPVLVALAHKQVNGHSVIFASCVWDGEFDPQSYVELSNCEAAANEVYKEPKCIMDAIALCISRCPEDRREYLWPQQHIILTGGRAKMYYEKIRSFLADGRDLLFCSHAPPNEDVIDGGKALSNLSTVRDLFTPVRSMEAYDMKKATILLKYAAFPEIPNGGYNCPLAYSIYCHREKGMLTDATVVQYGSPEVLEMCMEQNKDLLMKCKRVFVIFTLTTSSYTENVQIFRVKKLFALSPCKYYPHQFTCIVYHPDNTQVTYFTTAYTAADFPPMFHFFRKQKEVLQFIEKQSGIHIPITIRESDIRK